MQRFFNTLISVDELEKAANNAGSDPGLVIIDCRFSLMDPGQGAREYKEGHIEGAVYAHLDDDLAGPITSFSGRHPLPEIDTFTEKLSEWGIRSNSQVVVYDHGPGAIAARLWWMMRWIGHRSVALLDGGFRAWCDAAMPVSDVAIEHSVKGNILSSEPNDPMWVTTSALEQELPHMLLTDARSRERFQGKTEPIDPVAGHIPGAVSMALEENLDQDGKFLDPEKLKIRFQKLAAGRLNDSDYYNVVHMCGSGVTACHNLLAMEIAGMSGSRLYVGSWSEWIRDPQRPVATGDK